MTSAIKKNNTGQGLREWSREEITLDREEIKLDNDVRKGQSGERRNKICGVPEVRMNLGFISEAQQKISRDNGGWCWGGRQRTVHAALQAGQKACMLSCSREEKVGRKNMWRATETIGKGGGAHGLWYTRVGILDAPLCVALDTLIFSTSIFPLVKQE